VLHSHDLAGDQSARTGSPGKNRKGRTEQLSRGHLPLAGPTDEQVQQGKNNEANKQADKTEEKPEKCSSDKAIDILQVFHSLPRQVGPSGTQLSGSETVNFKAIPTGFS
jgi:hypothetical protein